MKRFYKFLMPLVALVAMALPWNASAQLTTVVADGTTTNSYIPIYGLWADDYTRSQFIYPVSMLEDLTAGSQITSLTFYSSTASQNWGAATFDVKLGEVTETTLSSYLTYTATTVYSGAITISNNLMTITFTNPYIYQGGNLMVEFFQTTEGTYHGEPFYGVSANGASASGYGSSNAASASFTQRNFLAKVQIEYTPGSGDICYRVRNLAATAITSDGCTLTWSDTLNTGASYTIYNMADTSVLGTSAGDSYTVSGLNSNTPYTLAVVADCGTGTPSTYATIAVRTACGGYTAVPYVEGFEDYTTSGNNPNCWMQIATGSSGSGTFPSVYNYSSNARNGSVYYEFESTNGATEIAALPAMANISSLAFTFYASVQNQNFVFEVGVLDDTTFEVVDTITLTTSTNWHNGYNPYTVYFANYTGVGDRIAMRVTAAPGTSYTLMLDDFTVEEFDGCYPVSNVQITDITPDGMTVTWDDDFNSGVSYNVYYRVSGNSNDTTVVNVSTNSYTLTGLDSYTRYYFAVEVDCGSGSVSDVSPTVNARTLRACPQPTELTVDTVSTDMITLSWTPGYQETSWLLGINDSLVEVNTNPYTITDLDLNTVYTLTLQSLCAAGDTSLVSSINVRTLAGAPISEFPYTCGFEIDDAGENEASIWVLENGTQTNKWCVGTAASNGGTKGLYISDNNGTANSYSTSSTSHVWAYATFSLADSGEYAVSYDWKCQGESSYYDFVRVFLAPASADFTAGSPQPFGTNTYNACQTPVPAGWFELTNKTEYPYTLSQSNIWNTLTTTFQLTTPGLYKLVFLWTNDGSGGTQPPAAIDNIYVNKLSCPAPTALTVDTVTADEITIHWTPLGEETSWDIQINDSIIEGVTSYPYVISDLEQYTNYTIAVRAVCSTEDFSFFSPSVTAQTLVACPWPTNFTATAAGDTATFTWTDGLGSAWEIVYGPMGFDPNTGTIEYPSTTSYEAYGFTTGFYDAYVRTDCGDSYSIWTGPVTFTVGVDVMNMATSGSDTLHTCAAIIYDNGGATASYSASCNSTLVLLPNTPGSELVITGNSYTESSYDYITIYEGVGTSGTVLWTDNGVSAHQNFGPFSAPAITVKFISDGSVNYDGFEINVGCTAPADCPRPSLFTCTSVAADSVAVVWNDVSAASYEVAYGTPGFNPDTAIAVSTTDSSYVFTTLLGGTAYEMYVRSNCGADGYSNWTGPLSVVPGQFIIGTTGSDTISMCGGAIYDNGGPTGNYSNNADYTLVVYPSSPDSLVTFSGSAYTESSIDYLKIYEGVGTSGTLLWQTSNSSSTDNIPTDTSLVGPITLQFHSDGSVVYSGFELFVNCVAAPDCLRPYAVTIPTVLADQITININGTASAYRAYITDGTTVDSVSITGNTYTFTNLTPLTTYTISVASDCGTELSDLTNVTATTTMVAATLPYSTGFEAGDDVAWFLENGTQANQWAIDSATNNGGSHALYISNDNGASNSYNTSSATNVYAYKVFTFDSVGDYGVSFDWKANGESCCDYLRVFLTPGNVDFTAGILDPITSSGTPAGWIALDGGTKLNVSSNWQNHFEIVSISNVNNYNLVFFWHNDGSVGSNPPAAIDNIQIGLLSCSTPTDVTVSNITGVSATITWTPNGGENEWMVTINGTSTVVSLPSYNATGLSTSTQYNVSVKAICAPGDTSFSSNIVNFTTALCDNAVVANVEPASGTTYYAPVNNYYNYTLTETIIDSAELAGIGSISTLAYSYAYSSASTAKTDVTIWLQPTDKTVFSSNSDMVALDTNTAVQVYSGDFICSQGWNYFTFTTPYTWDGHSNLLIIVDDNSGDYDNSSYTFDKSPCTGYKTIAFFDDYDNPDPLNPTSFTGYNTNTYDYRPTLQLINCGGGNCEAPAVTIDTVGELMANIHWMGSSSSYEVAVVQGTTWVEPSNSIAVADSFYTFTGLTEMTDYIIGVRGVCGNSHSAWTTLPVTTLRHPCAVPTNIAVSDETFDGATVSWTAGEAETDWQVRVFCASPVYDNTIDVSGTPSVVITGLANDAVYSVAVRAVCDSAWMSVWSDTVTLTPVTCPQVTDVGSSNVTFNAATITWNPSGAASYELEYGNTGFQQGSGHTATSNTASFNLTGLEEMTTYDVFVRSVCATGVTSEWSAKYTFTTPENNGIDDVAGSDVTLFPNPASTMVTIRGIEGESTVTVVDLNGREVYKTSANDNLTIDLTGYAKGAYFVRITGERTTAIRKLIAR